jgi:hypothetical protein
MFIYSIYNHNWRNISTIYKYIYIYNKTSIKQNILTIKQCTAIICIQKCIKFYEINIEMLWLMSSPEDGMDTFTTNQLILI